MIELKETISKMIRRNYTLLLFLLIPLLMSATEKPTSIVRDFFSFLNTYIIENDHEYHKRLLNMCSDGFVVSDVCALENVDYQTNSVTLDVYLQIMKNKMAKVIVNSSIVCNVENHRTCKHPGLTVVEVDITITSPKPLKFGYKNIHDYVYIDKNGKIIAIGDRDADNMTVGQETPEVQKEKQKDNNTNNQHNETLIENNRIFFEDNSEIISSEYYLVLLKVAKCLSYNDILCIEIRSYYCTDSDIAKKRVDAVEDVLNKKFMIDASRIKKECIKLSHDYVEDKLKCCDVLFVKGSQ